MCICINCLYVNKCGTYYLIEKQHNQSHLNSNPLFIAHSPILNVSVTSDKLNIKKNLGQKSDVLFQFYAIRGIHLRLNKLNKV